MRHIYLIQYYINSLWTIADFSSSSATVRLAHVFAQVCAITFGWFVCQRRRGIEADLHSQGRSRTKYHLVKERRSKQNCLILHFNFDYCVCAVDTYSSLMVFFFVVFVFFFLQLLSSSDILDLKYRNGTATLSINEVYPEDEGLYKCKATNSLGTAETTCRLTVQSKSYLI